jgi:hypothetical protein
MLQQTCPSKLSRGQAGKPTARQHVVCRVTITRRELVVSGVTVVFGIVIPAAGVHQISVNTKQLKKSEDYNNALNRQLTAVEQSQLQLQQQQVQVQASELLARVLTCRV